MAAGQQRYSIKEEIANSVTHGIGTLFGVFALVTLVLGAVNLQDRLKIISFSIYGGSMILLFSASALYHGVQNETLKSKLRIFDHCAIYVLIAGTYTSFCLVILEGAMGWLLFGLQWTCALVGIFFTILSFSRFKKIEIAMYLAMGWMVVIAIRPLSAVLPKEAGFWMLAGGLCYTGGVVFYKWKKLAFNHAVWHLFVLAGSVFHFLGIYLYVLPAK